MMVRWASDFHAAMRVLTRRYRLCHQSSSSSRLPMGTPSARIGVPSGVQFGTMFLGAENISLRSLPKRRPSRLFMFSFMPVASHHVSRCFCMCGRSGGLAMRVVSSANWEILWRTPLVSTPMMFGSCCTRRVSASVMQRKSTELSGHPCATLNNAGVELEGFACVAVDADLSLGRFGFVVEEGDVFDEVVAEAEVGEARF